MRQRVADLLERLTVTEKIALLHQWQAAVPRLDGITLVDETLERGTTVESTDAGGWILFGNEGKALCTFTVPDDSGPHGWHEVSMPVA